MPRGLYFVNSQTNQKIPLNGVQRSTDRLDCDPFCNHVKLTEGQLPKVADLRRYMPEVENQLTTRSWWVNTQMLDPHRDKLSFALISVANALAGNESEFCLERLDFLSF